MGWFDRLHDAVTALGGSAAAPLGFVKDVVSDLPELGQLQLGDFLGDIYHQTVNRGGQALGGLIGPQGTGGEAIGGLPEGIRHPVRAVVEPIEQGLDRAYKDVVSRPLSATLTLGSLADRPGGGGVLGLFRGSNVAEAWNIAEHRSPGQSLALAFLTKDILDPAELQRAKTSQAYEPISGTFDAVTRLTLDPAAEALASKVEYLKGLNAIDSPAAIAYFERKGLLDKFVEKYAAGKDAATYRHVVEPGVNNADGAWRADVITRAGELPPSYTQGLSGPALQKRVLRAFLGAPDELDAIAAARPDITESVKRMFEKRENLRDMTVAGEDLANHADDLEAANAELAATLHTEGMLDRLDKVAGTITEFPRFGPLDRLRAKVTLGDTYQHSRFAKPVRWVYDMEPTHLLNVERAQSDAQVWRQLQKSSLPLDRQLELRSNYLNLQDSAARATTYHTIENEIINKKAADAGMSREDLDAAFAEMNRRRGLAQDRIDSRTYDGKGRSVMEMEGPDGDLVKKVISDQPIYETQLPKLVPMVDLDRVDKSLSKIRTFLRKNPGYPLAGELKEAFLHTWKPSVLIHGGFAVRINTDEALRAGSRIGVLATARGVTRGGLDAAATVLKKVGIDLGRDIAGNEGFLVGPYAVGGLYGAPGDANNIYRNMMGARESLGSLVDRETGELSNKMMKGDWSSISPTDPKVSPKTYAAAYQHAVNNQIGRSPLGRFVLDQLQSPTKAGAAAGEVPRTVDEVVANTTKWLHGTDEGQATLRSMWSTGRTADVDTWIRDVAVPQINDYLPTSELKAAAWNGTATYKMLTDAVPDAGMRPVIHGGIVDESMNRTIGATWGRFVDAAMNGLVAKPNEYLIRNPFSDHMFHAEVTRQIALRTGERQVPLSERLVRTITGVGPVEKTGVTLTGDELANIEARARRYTLDQTKSLLHDYAEHPRAAKMLGMLSPFYSAWSQVLGRWAGIAIDNPAYVRRLRLVWRSPERAGLVTDGKGNVIDEYDRIETPVPNSQYKVGDPAADDQRKVTLRLPGWAHNVPGLSLIEGTHNKDSLNLLAHGFPSVGPFVQASFNEVAKQRPELTDSLKFALPYGTYQNVIDTFKPTILRRIESEQADPRSDTTFRNVAFRLYTDRVVDFQRGKIADKPTWDGAVADAKAFEHVRTMASLFLPSSPMYASPYQPWIDALHARRELDAKLSPEQKLSPDYKTPDEWFLDTYGPEFFPLVASMSKSIDAVQPTVEGEKVHAEKADLLAKYPELGGLIVGAEGAGVFNETVYRNQFSNRIGPNSDLPERQTMPVAEYETEASTSLGWIRFGKAMDMIEAIQHERGLPSLQVKGARDLLALKQGIVEILATDPSTKGWYDDYVNTDGNKWNKNLAGMGAIVADPRFADRQDIQGLGQYLKLRKFVYAQLQARGLEHLDAQHASDIAAIYHTTVSLLAEENPAFAALYHRYLQNDPVATTPTTEQALAGTLTP